MALSAPGIGSNLDVNGIVSQLMELERRPLAALAQREGRLTAQLSVIGRIRSMLSGVETAAKALETVGAKAAFRLTSSEPTSISGSAASSAVDGSHRITVAQLAQAQALVAAGRDSTTDTIGDAQQTTLTIRFGTITGGNFDAGNGKYDGATFNADPDTPVVKITIDVEANSLAGIRDAINASGAGLRAAIVHDGGSSPYRLTIVSTETGAGRSMQIETSGNAGIAALMDYDPGGTQHLAQTQAAQDARFSVNGLAISRPFNTATDVIEGISLTLSAIVSEATITVARDTAPLRSALEGLVKAYNETNKTVASATGYKAVLQGDNATVGIQTRLRAALGDMKSGLEGGITTLSQLGVRFQTDGSLAFDASAFQTAVDTDLAAASRAAASFGAELGALAANLAGASGAIQARTDGINRSIGHIDRQRSSLLQRLEIVEKRYRAQFAALDAMLASMLQTSNYLQQQLDNLPKINRT